MCRLLGINAGLVPVNASFWLVDSPDSLVRQSYRDPDGSGIGWFAPGGIARMDKAPIAAYRDPDFGNDESTAVSQTFLAHVRLASTGERSLVNTHPFLMDNRLMAQNGAFGDLELIEDRLGDYRRMVHGDTDSERFFALITRETDERGGRVAEGIVAAARWVADRLPMQSLNSIVISEGHMWALRYPDRRALHVLKTVGVAATTSRMRVAVEPTPVVVVASERLDDNPGWRMLAPGELLHVAPDLTITTSIAVDVAPRCLVDETDVDVNDDS
jgi:predicted glutamine amidotransferase